MTIGNGLDGAHEEILSWIGFPMPECGFDMLACEGRVRPGKCVARVLVSSAVGSASYVMMDQTIDGVKGMDSDPTNSALFRNSIVHWLPLCAYRSHRSGGRCVGLQYSSRHVPLARWPRWNAEDWDALGFWKDVQQATGQWPLPCLHSTHDAELPTRGLHPGLSTASTTSVSENIDCLQHPILILSLEASCRRCSQRALLSWMPVLGQ